MSDGHEPAAAERRAVGSDLIIPALALGFTLYYFSTILDSPWTAQVSAFFIGTILIALILVLFARTAVALARGEAGFELSRMIDPVDLLPIRLTLLGLAIGYLVALEYAGFTLATFAFLAASMLVLRRGRQARRTLAFSAGLAVLGYGIFILAFETRFEPGPFEALMKLVIPDGR